MQLRLHYNSHPHMTDKPIRHARVTATGSVAALPASIYAHGQSTLPDGKIIVSGGGKTFIYIPSSNEWEIMATVPANLQSHGQSTLGDGRVLISGGSGNNPTYKDTVYMYTPSSNTWEEVTPLATGISHHSQSTLLDDRVLISGGFNPTLFNTSYMYVPSSNKWNISASMQASSVGHRQSTLRDGRVLVSGGQYHSSVWKIRDTTYIYTPSATGSWATMSPLATSIAWHGQSTLFDGRILISGGSDPINVTFNASYIYATSANKWVSAAPLATGISVHSQSTLADGRVLISGGSTNNVASGSLSTAYIYTPAGWALKHAQAIRREGTKLIDKIVFFGIPFFF